jgi:hypothetical protein
MEFILGSMACFLRRWNTVGWHLHAQRTGTTTFATSGETSGYIRWEYLICSTAPLAALALLSEAESADFREFRPGLTYRIRG